MDSWGNHLDNAWQLAPTKLLHTLSFYIDLAPDLWDLILTINDLKQIIFMTRHDESWCSAGPFPSIRSSDICRTGLVFRLGPIATLRCMMFAYFFHIFHVSTLFNLCLKMLNYWSGLAPWASGPANWGPHFGLWWVSWSKFSAVIDQLQFLGR